MPTRYSWFLISFGTPISILNPPFAMLWLVVAPDSFLVPNLTRLNLGPGTGPRQCRNFDPHHTPVFFIETPLCGGKASPFAAARLKSGPANAQRPMRPSRGADG